MSDDLSKFRQACQRVAKEWNDSGEGTSALEAVGALGVDKIEFAQQVRAAVDSYIPEFDYEGESQTNAAFSGLLAQGIRFGYELAAIHHEDLGGTVREAIGRQDEATPADVELTATLAEVGKKLDEKAQALGFEFSAPHHGLALLFVAEGPDKMEQALTVCFPSEPRRVLRTMRYLRERILGQLRPQG